MTQRVGCLHSLIQSGWAALRFFADNAGCCGRLFCRYAMRLAL